MPTRRCCTAATSHLPRYSKRCAVPPAARGQQALDLRRQPEPPRHSTRFLTVFVERLSPMKTAQFAALAAILACAIAVSACANTVRGAGQDVKGTVKAVEDTVE